MDLIPEGIEPGTILIVEYDPESQWLAVATTIATRFLAAGGYLCYVSELRSTDDVKRDFTRLGADIPSLVKTGRLFFYDYYSAGLTGGSLPSIPQHGFFENFEGGRRVSSLKIADLSIQWLKDSKYGYEPEDVVEKWPPGALAIAESASQMLRFNDESAFVEYAISRVNPNERKANRINVTGFVRGVHSESFYRRIEDATDGVVDIRVSEKKGEPKNLLRVRSLKGKRYDARWHEITIGADGEATLKPLTTLKMY